MITNNLNQVAQWLQQHAQRIVKYSLNQPAGEAALAQLRQATPKELPPDFVQLYQTYNGMNDEENSGNFFYGMTFFSIAEILADLQFGQSVVKGGTIISLENTDSGIDSSNLYNPGWVPFGSDGSRCRLALDLSPAEGGIYGQIIFTDSEKSTALLIAASTSALIQQFADDIVNGKYTLNDEALEDGQHFLEPVTELDIINWHHIDKWKKYL
jgi:cell wall assembly regulator SMI1